jgi:hypothetical protein
VPAEGLGAARMNAELGQLVGAQRARAMAIGWRAAALVLSAVGVMAIVLAALLWRVALVAGFVLAAMALVAAVIGLGGSQRARRRDTEARAELDEAWSMVAEEVLRARGRETTAAQLAVAMQTDEQTAEALLAMVAARDGARVQVTDDAELTYSTRARIADAGAHANANANVNAEADGDANADARARRK